MFSRDIAPIFVANCTGCHGGAQPKGQLNLTSFNKMMAGGKMRERLPTAPQSVPAPGGDAAAG